MLIASDAFAENALAPLSREARSAWLDAIGSCGRLRTDILAPRDLGLVDDATVDEWEREGLAKRLPFGNMRFLARGELWDLS